MDPAEEYRTRLGRVVAYIEKNLDRQLLLDELARIAGFSRFHFPVLFFSLMGETLFHFIQRLRLEKAAVLLLIHPHRSITDIAFECGFCGSADFTRSFRLWAGVPPTAWRRGRGKRKRDHGRQSDGPVAGATAVEVRDLPRITAACLRRPSPYRGTVCGFQKEYGRLFRWAGARDLLRLPQVRPLVFYHDRPEISAEEKVRVSCGILVPPETEIGGEICRLVIPAGTYALARFELGAADCRGAWRWVFGEWLPRSGCLPGDGPRFELYPDGPGGLTEGRRAVDICLAVRPIEFVS